MSASSSNFSFTFNLDPSKGDFILKKQPQPQQSSLKSLEERSSSTTSKSSALENLKSVEHELDQVSSRLAQQQSSTKKSSSSSKKSSQSITSTPTRLNNNKEKDETARVSSAGDLFNQDSFISSIPDHRTAGEDDTTLLSSSIHRMHRNMRQKKKVRVFLKN